jgi:filamentous hemagglutinin family protein
MKIDPSRSVHFSAASSWARLVKALLPALALGLGSAAANPVGPTVAGGSATFSQQGNVLSITNSPNAIINWSGFSIQAGEITRFIQQSGGSAVLNRITGQDPSRILGALQSNGRVYLINPNGILFGANAQVNVAGLVASSLAISNADFLAGKNNFAAGDVAGSVVNQGAITTPSGGQVLLIAPSVSNSGIITSPQGEVLLAAGRSVQLADSGDPAMHVLVSAPIDQAINLGAVIAQGGKIGIYGALVNQRGNLNASSAVVGENGKIVLKASGTTLLEAGSATTAAGVDRGGEIQLLGEQVGLTGDARVDASGQNGGGTVLVGGDYQGANPAVMNAQQVYVGKDARISADAVASGNGGKAIVWGDRTAQVYGAISARGGAQGGDGGFIETSGHYLDVAGIRIDAGAPNGKTGKWLLDPYNITVESPGGDLPLSQMAAFANFADGITSSINVLQIAGATADVTLQARNDINFNAAVNISQANVGLKAQAGNNINVNASIATNGGALALSANDNGGGTASGIGRVNLQSGITLTTNGGSKTVTDSLTAAPAPAAPPPSADICTIAPNSALCQILSPPTASQPVKPVQQASNEVIDTIVSTAPQAGTESLALTKDDAKEPKSDDKTAAPVQTASAGSSKDASVKKMYCN